MRVSKANEPQTRVFIESLEYVLVIKHIIRRQAYTSKLEMIADLVILGRW